MTTGFHGIEVWPVIRKAVRGARRPAYVAVAYFGQGASKLLPLPLGSHLVVDASEAAVRGGQTCPSELAKLQKRGVRIFSASNLHAKVYVVDSKVFVGSANASRRSSDALVEAVVVSSDRAVVTAARRFVIHLCLSELGPDALARLCKVYRPPKLPTKAARQRSASRRRVSPGLPNVRIAQLVPGEWPEWTEGARKRGRKVAKDHMTQPRRYEIDEFSWHRNAAFKPGDVVVQVLKQEDGRRFVSPPGTVLHVEKWSRGGGASAFVYLEAPARRRVRLERLARRIGKGAKTWLMRSGRVPAEFAARLLESWADRRER